MVSARAAQRRHARSRSREQQQHAGEARAAGGVLRKAQQAGKAVLLPRRVPEQGAMGRTGNPIARSDSVRRTLPAGWHQNLPEPGPRIWRKMCIIVSAASADCEQQEAAVPGPVRHGGGGGTSLRQGSHTVGACCCCCRYAFARSQTKFLEHHVAQADIIEGLVVSCSVVAPCLVP